MVDLIGFMRTGKLRPYDQDKPEYMRDREYDCEEYSYLGFYLSLFDAALEYHVVGLPEAIESFIKKDTHWVPTLADISDEAHRETYQPLLYSHLQHIRELECKYQSSLATSSPIHGEQKEAIVRLKSTFFEKYSRCIANIEGIDDDAWEDDENYNEITFSYLKILSREPSFQADLYAALMKVKRGYEELY